MSAKHKNLSDDTQTRISMLVENSAPNPDRPRFSSRARDRRLEDIERRTAACYASMEDLRHKLNKLVRSIRAKALEIDLVAPPTKEMPEDAVDE